MGRLSARGGLSEALGRLQAGDRALLELSFRRGLEDADIAGALAASEEHVRAQRAVALERLAAEAGEDPAVAARLEAVLRALPESEWPYPRSQR